MEIKELYGKLLQAKRPIDFFGNVNSESELNIAFMKYVPVFDPEFAQHEDEYITGQALSILNELHELGLKEIKQGIYSKVNPISFFKSMSPIFELTIDDQLYQFYWCIYAGEVAYIFKGASENDVVYLKVAIDPSDNDLIDTEYDVLSTIRHQSLPYVEKEIKVNDSNAILMREVKGITMQELLNQYSDGVPAEHVMWMMERMLSVAGYLHSNFVVHGNIKPENIIINKDNHNVSLLGLSFCIKCANTPDSHYKILNDFYSAPEVSKTAKVLPSSDIYSIGKIAIELLGGDIKTGEMPNSVDVRIKSFIAKMVSENPSNRPNDVWELWTELRKIRTEVFGAQRFKTLN